MKSSSDKEDERPAFVAIANAPSMNPAKKGDNGNDDEMQFLLKKVDGEGTTTVANVLKKRVGENVYVSAPMGKGFRLPSADEENDDDEQLQEVVLFATGSGISPIKALLDDDSSKLSKAKRKTLFYGTRNPEHKAYGNEELRADVVVDAFSDQGRGYVQDYFERMFFEEKSLQLKNPSKAVAILCGQKEMTEAAINLLTRAGIPAERCLMNF